MADDSNIFTAAGDGELDKVKAFVASGEDVNSKDSNGYSAIHAAASYGNADVLRWLLENGGRTDLTDNDGDTPLHVCETAECADLLLEKGAVLTAANLEGLTPYHIAVSECRDEMILWLGMRYQERGLALPEVEHGEDDGEMDDGGAEDGQ